MNLSRYSSAFLVLAFLVVALALWWVAADRFAHDQGVQARVPGDGARAVLGDNSPNPFTDSTSIYYFLPAYASVRLVVLNPEEEVLDTLADAARDSGWHEVVFDARDLEPGTYLYRLYMGDEAWTRELRRVRPPASD